MRKTAVSFAALVIICAIHAGDAKAQSNSYQQTNLVSDIQGMANHTDPKLINDGGDGAGALRRLLFFARQ